MLTSHSYCISLLTFPVDTKTSKRGVNKTNVAPEYINWAGEVWFLVDFLFNSSDWNSTASTPAGIRVNEGKSHVVVLPVGIMKILLFKLKRLGTTVALAYIYHSAAQNL